MKNRNLLSKSTTFRYLSLLVFLLFSTINTQAEEIITEPIHTLELEEDGGNLAFSPDGQWALSGSSDKTVKLWDVNTGSLVRSFEGYSHSAYGLPKSNSIYSLAFSPDGLWALSGGGGQDSFDMFYLGEMHLYNVNTGDIVRSFSGHDRDVYSVAFSPDGLWALSGGYDETLKLWDVNTGSLIRTFTGHTSHVYSVAFSSDGLWALSGAAYPDNTLKLWDVNTGSLVRTFTGHTKSITSVAFSPDGLWALSGSRDTTLKLWEVNTGNLVRSFTGHTSYVHSVAFSPNGLWALSGSSDNTLKLWKVSTGSLVRTFTGHKSDVDSVAFSPDGQTALSGSWDNTLKLWDLGLCLSDKQCNYSIEIDQPGFYIATVKLPEGGGKEGMWGVEFATSDGVNLGGFNSGAILKENGDKPGFMAFYLSQAEAVNITPYEYTGEVSQMKIQLSRQENGERTVIFAETIASGQTHTTAVLQPGFYVAEAFSELGSPRGRFGFEISAKTMSGGVNIGGWIDFVHRRQREGFGGLYVGKSQTVEVNVFFGESYSSAGSDYVELNVYRQDNDERILIFSSD